MVLDAGDHAVVMGCDPAAQRMGRLDKIHDGVLAACANVVEVLIALSHDGFPYQKLSGIKVRQLVCACSVLRYPGRVNRAGITVLQNAPN